MPDIGLEEKLRNIMSGLSDAISPEMSKSMDAWANYVQSRFESLSNETGASLDFLMEKLKASNKNIEALGKVAKEMGIPFDVTRKSFHAIKNLLMGDFKKSISSADAGLKRYTQTVKVASQIRADTIKDEINALKKATDMGKNYNKEIKVLTKLREQQLSQAKMERMQQGFVGKAVGVAEKIGVPGAGAMGGILKAGTVAGLATGGIAALVVTLKKLGDISSKAGADIVGLSEKVTEGGRSYSSAKEASDFFVSSLGGQEKMFTKFGKSSEEFSVFVGTAMAGGVKNLTNRMYDLRLKALAPTDEAAEKMTQSFTKLRFGAGYSQNTLLSLTDTIGKDMNLAFTDLERVGVKLKTTLGKSNVNLNKFTKATVDIGMSAQESGIGMDLVAETLKKAQDAGYGFARAQARTREMIMGPRTASRAMRAYIGRTVGMEGTALGIAGRVRFAGEKGKDMSKEFMGAQLKKFGVEDVESFRKAIKTGEGTDAQFEMAEKLAMIAEKAGISEQTVMEELGLAKKTKDVQSSLLQLGIEDSQTYKDMRKNLASIQGNTGMLGKFVRHVGAFTKFAIPKFAVRKQGGGIVGGNLPMGAPTTESLEAGEFVSTQDATEKFRPQLEAMNMGMAPGGGGRGGTQTIRLVLETPTGEILKEVNAEIRDNMLTVEGQ